jgi:hypothetical protein
VQFSFFHRNGHKVQGCIKNAGALIPFLNHFWLARIFHRGHARVGCDAVRWQGETTLRAHARKEEQRSQRAAARLARVCSARTKLDLALEAKKVSIHAVLRGIEDRPGEICGLGAILFI